MSGYLLWETDNELEEEELHTGFSSTLFFGVPHQRPFIVATGWRIFSVDLEQWHRQQKELMA